MNFTFSLVLLLPPIAGIRYFLNPQDYQFVRCCVFIAEHNIRQQHHSFLGVGWDGSALVLATTD